jgi:hypothetical protein
MPAVIGRKVQNCRPKRSVHEEQKMTTATEQTVREALRQVIDPEMGVDVVTMGMVRQVEIDEEGKVEVKKMPPFLYGGDMIADVTLEQATWNKLPWKFEAGTANVCGGPARLTTQPLADRHRDPSRGQDRTALLH